LGSVASKHPANASEAAEEKSEAEEENSQDLEENESVDCWSHIVHCVSLVLLDVV
jgi:hypothetical protein